MTYLVAENNLRQIHAAIAGGGFRRRADQDVADRVHLFQLAALRQHVGRGRTGRRGGGRAGGRVQIADQGVGGD